MLSPSIPSAILCALSLLLCCPDARSQGTPPTFDQLLARLQHQDPQQRRGAVRGMGALGDRRAIEPLTAALGDASHPVREDAVDALQQLGAVMPLIGALADDQLRLQVVQVLGTLGDRRAVEPLIESLANGDETVRCYAAKALQKLGDPRAIVALITVLGDEDAAASKAAADTLAALGWQPEDDRERAHLAIARREWQRASDLGEIAIEPLIAALARTDPGGRRAAADALDRLGWQPETTDHKARYLLARQQWDDLVALGRPAVAPLLVATRNKRVPVEAPAVVHVPEVTEGKKAAEDLAIRTLYRIGKPATDHLVGLLSHEDWHVRGHAAQVLGRLGHKDALAPLEKACGDRHPFVRGWAMQAFAALGGPRATPRLVAGLRDAHPEVRMFAAQLLAESRDQGAAEGLTKALEDPDPTVRQIALMGLQRLGGLSNEHLRAALRDPDSRVRAGAAEELGQSGDEGGIPPLVSALADESLRVRMQAAAALRKLGWKPATREQEIRLLLATDMSLQKMIERVVAFGPDAVGPLIELLGDGRGEMRFVAVQALGAIGPAAKAAIPALRAALEDNEREVRQWAEFALAAIGAPGPAYSVERLIAKLQTGGVESRLEAATRLGRTDERAVQPLIAALEDEDVSVRQAAARSLGELKDTRAVLPLTERLRDESLSLVMFAAEALGEIGDPRAVAPLVELLRDPRIGARSSAAMALDKLDWEPSTPIETAYYLAARQRWDEAVKLGLPALAALKLALDDENTRAAEGALRVLPRLRHPEVPEMLIAALRRRPLADTAARALGDLGDPRAVGPLIAALEQGFAQDRAIIALGHLGDPRAVGPLLRFSKYRDYIAMADRSLVRMGQPAVVPLASFLQDKDVGVRRRAAKALRGIGPLAAAALPELTRAAGDGAGDAEVRSLAQEAVEKIRNGMRSRLANYASVEGVLHPSMEPERKRVLLEELLSLAGQQDTEAPMLCYLEGRLLQVAGKPKEAAAKYQELVATRPPQAEPYVRWFECHRETHKPLDTEQQLIGWLREGPKRRRPLWEAWFVLSTVDLQRSPRQTLATMMGTKKMPPGRYPSNLRWVLEQLARDGALRVNCGGPKYEDAKGIVWRNNRFMRSGIPSVRRDQPIAGTEEDPLYHTETSFYRRLPPPRGYQVPLAPGRYRITLHFAEIFFRSPGRRRFDVLLEGDAVLRGYVPPINAAETFTFERRVEDGLLDIEFIHRDDNPKISAFEITRVR